MPGVLKSSAAAPPVAAASSSHAAAARLKNRRGLLPRTVSLTSVALLPVGVSVRAFSSEVGTGSREENASNQNHRARF